MARILGRKVFRRVRAKGFAARSVTLKLKYADFRSVSRTAAVPGGVRSGENVGDLAVDLLTKTEAGTAPVRLIGVGLGSLTTEAEVVAEQLEFDF